MKSSTTLTSLSAGLWLLPLSSILRSLANRVRSTLNTTSQTLKTISNRLRPSRVIDGVADSTASSAHYSTDRLRNSADKVSNLKHNMGIARQHYQASVNVQ
jgi:hypothetical protein